MAQKYIRISLILLFSASFLVSCQAVGTGLRLIPQTGGAHQEKQQPEAIHTSAAIQPEIAVATSAIESNRSAAAPTIANTQSSEKPADTNPVDSFIQPAGKNPTTRATPGPSSTHTQSPVVLSPEDWKSWPALPQGVSPALKEIYRRGIANGNDPHAFSILGDCQSQPNVFMGIFETDRRYIETLPVNMQETIAYFKGSFNRKSPTVKDGTTEGALLWVQWNDNPEKKCNSNETPLDCELRTHKPSIVFLHVGTHWEARNRHYQEIIIQKILDHGAVPILVTKADNREKDERVNKNLASLAAEQGLPFWNFWPTVQHLPDNGLKPGSDMYLSQEAIVIHRLGALEALDAVWRAVRE